MCSPFFLKAEIWSLTIRVLNVRMGEAPRGPSSRSFYRWSKWNLESVWVLCGKGQASSWWKTRGENTTHLQSNVLSVLKPFFLSPSSVGQQPFKERAIESYKFPLCRFFSSGPFPVVTAFKSWVREKKYWHSSRTAFIRTKGPARLSHGNSLMTLSHTDHLFVSLSGSVYSDRILHPWAQGTCFMFLIPHPLKASSWENINLGITHWSKLCLQSLLSKLQCQMRFHWSKSYLRVAFFRPARYLHL